MNRIVTRARGAAAAPLVLYACGEDSFRSGAGVGVWGPENLNISCRCAARSWYEAQYFAVLVAVMIARCTQPPEREVIIWTEFGTCARALNDWLDRIWRYTDFMTSSGTPVRCQAILRVVDKLRRGSNIKIKDADSEPWQGEHGRGREGAKNLSREAIKLPRPPPQDSELWKWGERVVNAKEEYQETVLSEETIEEFVDEFNRHVLFTAFRDV